MRGTLPETEKRQKSLRSGPPFDAFPTPDRFWILGWIGLVRPPKLLAVLAWPGGHKGIHELWAQSEVDTLGEAKP